MTEERKSCLRSLICSLTSVECSCLLGFTWKCCSNSSAYSRLWSSDGKHQQPTSALCRHFVYTVENALACWYFPLLTPFSLRQRIPGSRPSIHLVFTSSVGKQQLATPPCGLIKLLRWLLSMSLIRPLAGASETGPVYGYSVPGPVVRAGSRGADRGGDDIQAHGERGCWGM